jgi:hypothetical protein
MLQKFNVVDIDFGSEADTPTLTLEHFVVDNVHVLKLDYLRFIRARSLMEFLCAFDCLFTVIVVVSVLCCW